MQDKIEVRLKPSRRYLALLAFLLLVCLLAIFLTRPDSIVLMIAFVWTLCACWDAYRRYYLLCAKNSIIALRLAPVDWSLQTANGDWHEVRLLGSRSTITAHLLCLSFEFVQPRRRFSLFSKPTVCLFSDSANPDDLRKLRVALLNSASEAVTSGGEHSIFGDWR